uniref:Uncharacterized protein n=1 Tax=Brassica oleracea var. oleracea TaxID=109376 RepID=A0A0D2ZS97_BRAOL
MMIRPGLDSVVVVVEITRRRSPSVYSKELSDELVVLGMSSEICFLGIPSENSKERRNSEKLFPRTCFVGMSSE